MLQTTHLNIKPHSPTDASVFLPFIQNNQVYLMTSFPRTFGSIQSLNELEKHYKLKEENWKRKKEFACAIFLRNNNLPVGYISLKNIDWSVPKGELAYFIFKENAGQGYATEAVKEFMDWCFAEMKFNRLYAKIITDNKASAKVVEKCGLVYEGTLKKDYSYADGTLVDIKIFGVTS